MFSVLSIDKTLDVENKWLLRKANKSDESDAESHHRADFLLYHGREFLDVLLEDLKLLIRLNSLLVE